MYSCAASASFLQRFLFLFPFIYCLIAVFFDVFLRRICFLFATISVSLPIHLRLDCSLFRCILAPHLLLFCSFSADPLRLFVSRLQLDVGLFASVLPSADVHLLRQRPSCGTTKAFVRRREGLLVVEKKRAREGRHGMPPVCARAVSRRRRYVGVERGCPSRGSRAHDTYCNSIHGRIFM